MKVTIYELLGMVKDGKAPKKFKYDDSVWTYNYESSAYQKGKGIEFEDYMDDGLIKYLNDTIEILEEKKKIPEKLEKNHIIGGVVDNQTYYEEKYNTEDIGEKVNEIIDYLDCLKSKGE